MLHPAKHIGEFSVRLLGIQPWSTYYEEFGRDHGRLWYRSIDQMAKYLNDNVPLDQKILLWGAGETMLFFLTGHESASRFGYIWPLVSPEYVGTSLYMTYRKEYISTISKKRPRYIVVNNKALSEDKPKVLEHFDFFPELKSIIDKHYIRKMEIGYFSIFEESVLSHRTGTKSTGSNQSSQ